MTQPYNARDNIQAVSIANEALKSSNSDITAFSPGKKGSAAKAEAAATAKAPDILTIPQLMARLAALWPRAFPSAASIEAWSAEYQRTLGGLDPARLAQGWEDVMQGWNKAGHPLPADIRQAVLHLADDADPGRNMKEFFEKTTLGAKQLVVDWQKKQAALLQQLATRHQPADDPCNSHLIRMLERLAKKQAWLLAQQHLAGVNLDQGVEICPEEIEKNRRYVDQLYGPSVPAKSSSSGSAAPVGQQLARVVESLRVPLTKLVEPE